MSRRVTVANAHRRYRLSRQTVAQYVRKVLRDEKKIDAAISVVLVDSRVARRINRQYLRHDTAPDVLSFPLEQDEILEAEIYVNLDRAREQAKHYGVSFRCEVARLVVHGTLHLLGYDDRTGQLLKEMKKQEDRHVAYWCSGRERKG